MIHQIILNIYAMLLLFFLRYFIGRYPHRASITEIWYKRALDSNVAILAFDTLTWLFDGYPGHTGYFLVYLSNGAGYALSLLPLSLWLCYLDACIIREEGRKKARAKWYLLLNVVCIISVLLNSWTDWLYFVDAGNHYVRHFGIYLVLFLNLLAYSAYLFSLRSYRQYISGRIYQVILLLGVLPSAGAIIQVCSFGLTLTWPFMALIAFATYVLVEREEIRKDTLTDLYTRSQLEERMQYKVSKQQPFSIILMDLDKFKSINDTYGHEEGDLALKAIGNLLEKCIRPTDTAYRYAGDEFILLLETKDPAVSGLVESRLYKLLEERNRFSEKPYVLSLTTGIAHYDGISKGNIFEIIASADEEMYRKK